MSKLCEHCADPSWTGQAPIKAPRLPTGDYILEFDTKDEFPEEGESGFLYVDLANNNFYKWDLEASEYILIGAMGDTDVVDIVPTHAALEAYDTSKLKDRDIVKVLADETEGGKITYYRWLKTTSEWELVGSQDPYYSKAQIDGMVGDLDDLETEDKTNLVAAINEVAANGGARVLTSADYNYPEDNPDRIAGWLLEDGCYVIGEAGIQVLVAPGYGYNEADPLMLVVSSNKTVQSAAKTVLSLNGKPWTYSAGIPEYYGVILQVKSNGDVIDRKFILTKPFNKLTSDSTEYSLSAKQGKVLKDLIDSLVIKGSGAPTTSTVGTVGKLYEDTTNGKLYQCTEVDSTIPEYTWEEVGGGPNVVQSTGQSTTDVMSQKAVTDIVGDIETAINEIRGVE